MSIELKKKVDEFLKAHNASVQIRQGYGLTECVTASCLTPKDYNRVGSIGVPFPDTYYKIVKPGTTQELDANSRGRDLHLGPVRHARATSITPRKRPTRSAAMRTAASGSTPATSARWTRTASSTSRQRIKRMIITSGYNVYPGQLENIIDGHEKVLLSCVIGVKDPYKMQKVKAFVVLRPGYEAVRTHVKQELLDYCRQHIAKYAMPYDIEFRAELPKTLVGKVAYRVLEEEEAERQAAEDAKNSVIQSYPQPAASAAGCPNSRESAMKKNDRIWELDALRGVCILCVIAVHLIFDLGFFIGLDLHLPAWYVFIQQYGGVIFVVLSGCCATLGSRSFRRGCIVFACGMLISLVTFGMYRLGMATRDVIVWFGVLHLLGVCMMLYPVYRRLPTPALAAIGIVLVVAGYLDRRDRRAGEIPVPAGPYFTRASPQATIFRSCRIWAGTCSVPSSAGPSTRTKKRACPARSEIAAIARFFCWCGRQSLFIYLLHQPIVYGLLELIASLKR